MIVCTYSPNTDIYTNVNPTTGVIDNTDIYYCRYQGNSCINSWGQATFVDFTVSINAITPTAALSSAGYKTVIYTY